MAMHSLYCADVPLRTCSVLTHSLSDLTSYFVYFVTLQLKTFLALQPVPLRNYSLTHSRCLPILHCSFGGQSRSFWQILFV